MFARQVWEAAPADTVIHRLNGRTKLAVLVLLGLAAVIIDSPGTLYFMLMAGLAGHAVARSSGPRWRILMGFILLTVWGSMVSQGLFYNQQPKTPLFCLASADATLIGRMTGGMYIYREGLEYGAVQALRSAAMVAYGLLLCWTTDPRELLRSLTYWRLPYKIAFMGVASLRFLPDIFSETATVLTAQRLRGFRPFKALNPLRIIRTAFQILFPVLARSIRRSAVLALSVESRGFGEESRRADDTVWPPGEKLLCLAVAGFFAIMILFKWMYWLHYSGIAFFPGLRGIYDFAKLWL